MKGIIIGGGIAGLATAISLKQAGISTQVFEAAPALRPAGAGIWMASNAMQALDRMGLAEKVKRAGHPLTKGWIGNGKLEILGKTDLSLLERKFGFSGTAIHRAALQEVLLGEIGEGSLSLGKRFASVEQGDFGVRAVFEDGQSAEGDFLLGADGIHSAVRKRYWPEHSYRKTGQICWRGVADVEIPERFQEAIGEAWGGAIRLGIVPLAPGRVYWFAVEKRDLFKDKPGEWKSYVMQRFGSFGKVAQQILASTPEEKIIFNELYDIPHLENWSRGRVLLIGDAGHATTPNMGQGGCQAVEDACFLGELFKRKGKVSLQEEGGLEKVFYDFEALRKKRVKKVVDQSLKIGKMAHWERGRGLRDFMLKILPGKMTLNQLNWLYDLPKIAN